VVDEERQLDWCYHDTLRVISEAKQRLFDVTRWSVTLQALVLGLVFSKDSSLSWWFLLLPVFVGGMSLALNFSLSNELHSHRKTLASIRKTVGGHLYRLNKEQVDYFADGVEPQGRNFYSAYKRSNEWIVGLSALGSLALVTARVLG
jgi:hypothetical protein